MRRMYRREPLLYMVGDLIFFFISLWVTLLIRYASIPTTEIWIQHIAPFSILFVVWVLVFFIAGLYEKRAFLLKRSLPQVLLNTQVTNSLLAVVFFYFIPLFGITPKTNLFIYLAVSFFFICIWRLYITQLFMSKEPQKALLIGSGNEVKELHAEVNSNSQYHFTFSQIIDVKELPQLNFNRDVVQKVYEDDISLIVFDSNHEAIEPYLPHMYNLIFSGVQFVDTHRVYESLFDRIPLSLLRYNWFLENISSRNHITYDFLKRVMDIGIAGVLGMVSLMVYPFVIFAIWFEDRGSPFIVQERIGQGSKAIKLIKFRSMRVSDGGVWPTENDDRITKTGAFIRKTRIDELPQLWNVVKGDISLIGPRPDIVDLFKKLSDQVPYYTIRNIVKPGLSGWAQTHQEIPPHSIEETKTRLAYDLYYIKNRSFWLDVKIGLQTIKTLISRTGR